MDFEEYGKTLPKAPSKQEQDRMFKEYAKTKDFHLRDKIVEANLRLPYSYISKYHTHHETYEPEDLIQIANIALVSAVETFDPTKNIAFSTYATICIKNALSTEFRNDTRHSIKPDFFLYDELISNSSSHSFDQPLVLIDTIKDESEPLSQDVIMASDRIKKVCNFAKKNFKKRDYEVFCDLLRIELNPSITQTSLADKYGVSHQVIAQIKKRIKDKLKEEFKSEFPELS